MPTLAARTDASEGETRSRYLRRVDVRSVLRIAAIFNSILGVALTFTGWLVIVIAAQHGLFDQINDVTSDLSTGHPMRVGALRLCIVWFFIVACWTVAMTVVAGLATMIFNQVLHLFGGIELDLRASAPPKVDVEAAARRSVRSVKQRLQPRLPQTTLRSDRARS